MSIYEDQIEAGMYYAQTRRYQRMLAFAQDGIAAMLDLAPHSYVSISFGKQSLCLAHMVYQQAPDTPMHFLASEETWEIDDYREVIDTFTARFPINLTIHQTRHFFSEPHRTWKESRDAGEHDLQEMCDRNEWDGWFWGLAKEESRGRKITLSTRWDGQPHPTIYRYADGKFRCCPLANWTIKEIAAYVATHDLRLLWTYRRFGLEMRTTARITRNNAEMAGMAYLKEKNQAGYNRIVARYPELRCYT
jgi:3'-phosphoadenosine 5'-phosphosulfate sulfotransferase (PAPS reductase)/FAD synthetase